MKKTKKLILIMGVALTLLTPVLGLIPPATGRAYAAPNDDVSIEDQVRSYIYMRAMAFCLANSGLRDGVRHDKVDKGHGNSYEWFEDNVSSFGHSTFTGLFDEDDGKVGCKDKGWQSSAYALWGWDDPVEALCNSGFRRDTDDGKYQSVAECMDGDDDFKRYGDDKGKMVNEFLKHVNSKFYDKDDTAEWPSLSDPMEYYYYRNSFINGCHAERFAEGDAWSDNTVDNDKHVFRMIGEDGKTPETWKADKEKNDTVTTRAKDDLSGDVKLACKDMVDKANDKADEYAAAVAEGSGAGSAGGSTESGAIDTTCAGFDLKTVFSLNWVICPFIATATAAANGLENVIAGMLCINESDIFGTDMTCSGEQGSSDSRNAFHNAWNVFRIIALGLLAIAGLIMIISQGLGFEIFDAYTIKKTLPRILVAGIGITLSWQLLEFVVTFSNAMGIGVRALIYQPFLDSGIDDVVLKGGSGAIGILFGAGSWFLLGPLGLLSFILTGLLAILVAFFILVIRNILVILLILVAPLAIAAYILPNTEKYWKIWWDWFFKALLAFPIITALIAIGHVFAAITTAKGGGVINNIVGFIAYFAPYFLIPAAFRLAGGALGTIGGFVNDRSRGGFDRLKQFRKGQSEKRMAYYGQKYGDKAIQARASMIRSLNNKASATKVDADGNEIAPGYGRRIGSSAMKFTGRQLGGLGSFEAKVSAVNARTAKQINDQIATGNDADIRGLTVDRSMGWQDALEQNKARVHTDDKGVSKRQWKSLAGAWIDEADVDKGQREWGKDRAAQQAALSYEMRKAMNPEDVQAVSDDYASLAKKQWGMTNTQAGGAWIGAAFENQNQHLEYKNTDIDYDTGQASLNVAKFSKEAYEKKGSYQLSQMSGHTITQLEQAYNIASGKQASGVGPINPDAIDVESQERIKAVAETFMHQMGGPSGEGEEAAALAAAASSRPTTGGRQVSSNGSGAVGEAVFRLARTTGVLSTQPARTAGSAGVTSITGPETPLSPGSQQSGTAPLPPRTTPPPPEDPRGSGPMGGRGYL